MTRRKRPYVPKVRGCYECSQRRVDCDRGLPSCAKCVSKGISCTGLGTRYRFSEDVAPRRKVRARHEPQTAQSSALIVPEGDGFEAYQHNLALCTGPDPDQDSALGDGSSEPWSSVPRGGDADMIAIDTTPLIDSERIAEVALPLIEDDSLAEVADDVSLISTGPIDATEPWKRYCLTYFSERIAPEMVVIDDNHNGWRYLVLPIAYQDELVRAAVLSTTTFQFCANTADPSNDPQDRYQEVIRGLRQRQDLQSQDVVGKQSVVLTLLLLLIAVMVNGHNDFHDIFRLLEAALNAVGGEEALSTGELGVFLVRQIRKFRGYAAPVLSQDMGLEILSQTALVRPSTSNGWECFRSYYSLYPNLSSIMSLIYDLHEQACQIYMVRVLIGSDGPAPTQLVDRYRSTMDTLVASSNIDYTLAWATFMAAAESRTPEHQQYFEAVLMRHYDRTGFANTLTALEYLRWIWRAQTPRDWTKLLPNLQTFIV